jgi:hypothetical protein
MYRSVRKSTSRRLSSRSGPKSNGEAEEVTGSSTWSSNPRRHYILQLGETGGANWEDFEKYASSSMKKRRIPPSNVFGELATTRSSQLFQQPDATSLAHLTAQDRLDLAIHGSRLGPSDSGGGIQQFTNYTPKLLVDKLKSYGLREIGVLRLDSCNVGTGYYLTSLKAELDKKGIKVGYLGSPNGYLLIGHLPLLKKRPVFQFRFWDPWNVMKGNLDVTFPGTKYSSNMSGLSITESAKNVPPGDSLGGTIRRKGTQERS